MSNPPPKYVPPVLTPFSSSSSNRFPISAWQTAPRGRHSHSATRTPQNGGSGPGSGTTSPNPGLKPSETPRAPPNNVWTQRSSAQATGSNSNANSNNNNNNKRSSSTSNGARTTDSTTSADAGTNGFNASQVKAFLGRDPAPAVYKVGESGNTSRTSGGSAWGSKGMFAPEAVH